MQMICSRATIQCVCDDGRVCDGKGIYTVVENAGEEYHRNCGEFTADLLPCHNYFSNGSCPEMDRRCGKIPCLLTPKPE